MADTYEFLNCPACGTPMKKVFLEKQGFIIDVCLDGCGGIWFDNRELPKVDERTEDISDLTAAYNGKTFHRVEREQDRDCPVCHKKMVKNCASAKQEITIDECYQCGGKFFDYNELEILRNQYESDEDRIADIKEIAKDSVKMEIILNRLMHKDDMI